MSKVSVNQVFPVSADVIWNLIGSFKLAFVLVQSFEQLVERLENLDNGARVMDYSILSPGPLPIANYKARIQVDPEGAGCRVTWSSEFDAEGAPASEAEAAIRGIYEAGFENLKKMFGAS